MRTPLLEQLINHQALTGGEPLKIGIINYGGTIMSIPSKEDLELLEPLQSKGEIVNIIMQNARVGTAAKQGLLELKVLYHNPMDSSQMLDKHRELCLHNLHAAYMHFDGFMVLHGTDTGALSARFLHLTLPYHNPLKYWSEGKLDFNWTKPVILVSSQEPAIEMSEDGKIVPLTGSDGDLNLLLAMILLIDKKIGEAGVLTSGKDALRGPASQKATESGFPQYICDPGIPVVAERTAFGINYNDAYFLPTVHQNRSRVPFVIEDSAQFQDSVLLVSEPNHLALCKAYLDALKPDATLNFRTQPVRNQPVRKLEDVAEYLKEKLPRVILYQSKGAGNVQNEDHKILKELEGHGIYVCKVPIPGGRIPATMHYNVPGRDIPGYNIEGTTARYKSQTVLALMNEFRIKPDDQNKFFHHMMNFRFGNEFLPTR